MEDSDATPTEEEFDEEAPGLVPDSCTDSETSEEEYVPPKRRHKRKKKSKRTKSNKGNRQKKRKISPKNKKARIVVARNTTYASKRTVADRDVVKAFLAQADCGCDKQCIKSLHALSEEGAVDVVLNLRKQRFACK